MPRKPRSPASLEAGAIEGRGGTRRLIAGLRISLEDEQLLAVVRPFLPDVDSESDLAYRLWRRGLEGTLAELVGLGVALPAGVTDDYVATLAAQRVVLALPLLHRTGKLSLLPLLPLTAAPGAIAPEPLSACQADGDEIDESASDTIVSFGGGRFSIGIVICVRWPQCASDTFCERLPCNPHQRADCRVLSLLLYPVCSAGTWEVRGVVEAK